MEQTKSLTTKECYDISDSILNEISQVLLGKTEKIRSLLTALFSGGHILIEDVPGVGKTTLASALAKATCLKCNRAQFTPDVTASDITGFNMYNRKTDSFEYREGLAMCNILLADEINRTSPKTQSSLLEAMEEKCVTVDGVMYPLPSVFMVIATQNPTGFVGTYPLPEAQLDRFLMKISLGYPDKLSEISLIKDRKTVNPLENVKCVASEKDIEAIRRCCSDIYINDAVYSYIVNLVSMTRNHRNLELGASPRASLALMKASQVRAFLKKREYVLPEDVRDVFHDVICHRLIFKQDMRFGDKSAAETVNEILGGVEMPLTGIH